MLERHSHPILPADFSCTRVEKVGHHRTLGERLLVLFKRFHLHKANSAIPEGMVISVAMRFLNDHFILKPSHVSRKVKNGLLFSPSVPNSLLPPPPAAHA